MCCKYVCEVGNDGIIKSQHVSSSNCKCMCAGIKMQVSVCVCAGRREAIPRAHPKALHKPAACCWPWPNALAILCACRRAAAVPAATHGRNISCSGHPALPKASAQSADQSAAPGLDWPAVPATAGRRSLTGVKGPSYHENDLCLHTNLFWSGCFCISLEGHFGSSVVLLCSLS